MQSITVGSDLVEVADDRVIIHARHPFMDWRIREFCRQPIFFKGQKFFLRQRHKGSSPYAIRYELEPWPENLHEESSAQFVYDDAAVAKRDADIKTQHQRTALWYLLLPLYPFFGLCWSGFKENVLWPIGFVPVSVTSASVFLVFCATFMYALFFGFLGGGVMIAAFGIHGLGGWAFAADLLVIAVLTLDCVTRFSQLLRDDTPVPDGFFEWLLPERFKHR
jgi:hypothetical protein